jgi:hypothetical protein
VQRDTRRQLAAVYVSAILPRTGDQLLNHRGCTGSKESQKVRRLILLLRDGEGELDGLCGSGSLSRNSEDVAALRGAEPFIYDRKAEMS